MPDLAPLVRAQIPEASTVLARAFDDSPIFTAIVPSARTRPTLLRSFFKAALRDALPFDEVYGAHDHGALVGVSCWLAPGRYPPSASRQVRQLGGVLLLGPLAPRGLAPALRFLRANERVHPKAVHWYLEILGVDPAWQGKGIGAALLRERLAAIDREGLPAYLETDKEQNLAWYAHHRFELRETLHPQPGGPPEWTMWRDPV